VASRRAREVLDYFQPLLNEKWYNRLEWLSRRITKSMGRLRETEVNLGLLETWRHEKKIGSVAAELQIFSQQREFARLNRKARNRIGNSMFSQIERFLSRMHGTYAIQSTDSGVLQRRNQEFLSFSWDGVMDDERLHDLRIRTKTFRYAVEIYDRLHSRNLGHFTRRIRRLQEVLGQIHDLYVLSELIRENRDKWAASGLSIIPRAFADSYEFVVAEKSKLYPQVLPLYSRVLENSPLLHVGVPVAAAV
jgi:CHAD domain-containing protein